MRTLVGVKSESKDEFTPLSMGDGMLPEVEEYFNAINDSDGVYNRALNEASAIRVPRWDITWNEEERTTYYEALEARQKAERAAERAYKERQAVAYQALMQSEDKLVQWLMTDEQVRDYSSQRNDVLRALPLTREEMEEYGEGRGWCGVYTDLYERAERAGVLPEPTPDLADVTALAADIRRNYGGSTKGAQRLIRRHLPALLESARVKAAEAATQNDGTKVAETASA